MPGNPEQGTKKLARQTDSETGGYIDLCPLADLLPDSARGFDPFGQGRDALFVVRRGPGVYAYRNLCPHQGSSLPWRKNAYLNSDASRIVCFAHGAEFEIETGRCTIGAALNHCLQPVPILIDKDGTIKACPEDLGSGPAASLP